jgi:glycosyltransferase involved in cell wall biosynthesis
MRGGEHVLSLLCGLFPKADLFTLIHTPGVCNDNIENRRIIASRLNRLPGVKKYYRHLLPFMPRAIERMDATDYDLIVSSSHCVAKGIARSPDSLHICYCHTPMRYIWSQGQSYQSNMGLSGLGLKAFGGYLRKWDLRSADNVDYFVANSNTVSDRIREVYNRESSVVYPPADTEFFTPADVEREDFYLMVTALAPYKRVDQTIDAFRQLGRKLVIIGTGQQMGKLRRLAPDNVEFLGWRSLEALRDHFRRCRALIFPGEEDFGIVPLEAMSCGSPIIAYGAGGATETVIGVEKENTAAPTGLLYTPQTVEALIQAVGRFEKIRDRFDPKKLFAHAKTFSRETFVNNFKKFIEPLLDDRGLDTPW